MATRSWSDLLSGAARAAAALLAPATQRTAPPATRRSAPPAPRRSAPPARPRATGAVPQGAYPGDYTGPLEPQYAPALDGDADPGEIVWTWVPYEEDFTQGKDRPGLVVGRDGVWLLAHMLTSKDPARAGAPESARGRRWLDVGSGPWDPRGRESEVRLDRVLRIDPDQVRREGAIMDERTFAQVTSQIG